MSVTGFKLVMYYLGSVTKFRNTKLFIESVHKYNWI